MTNLVGNSAVVNIRLTRGATYVLPIVRSSGSAIPAFNTLTLTGNIYTQNDETSVATFTVTAAGADNMTVTISATTTAALNWNSTKYGYNVKGVTGSTVYVIMKGSISPDRWDG